MVNHYTVRGMCSLGSIVAGCVYGEPLHCAGGYVLSGLIIVPIAVFLPALATVFLALRYFPLFACVEAPLPFLGHCLGLAYSALWYVGEECSALCWWVHLILGRVLCTVAPASCTLILLILSLPVAP